MPHAHITKIEDARTGQWLRHLDPITDPIKRIDMGWTMGDWNQLDVTTETVGLRECFSFLLLASRFFPSFLSSIIRAYLILPPDMYSPLETSSDDELHEIFQSLTTSLALG